MCATLDLGGQKGIFEAEDGHSSGETKGIEFSDGECTVAALCASWAANQPRTRPLRGIGQRGIHNLHEFAITRRKTHAAKDTGLESGLERFRFKCCHLKIMRGGIFLRKMPLGVYVSVKRRIETAVVG
jgi:hypothetical protein